MESSKQNLFQARPTCLITGKTALVDCTIHLDPDLAKHRLGRDIMQKLEDMYGVPGVEGPAVEISQRLPLWPHRCATWSRKTYHISGEGMSQSEVSQQQSIPYHILFFTVRTYNHSLSTGSGVSITLAEILALGGPDVGNYVACSVCCISCFCNGLLEILCKAAA